MIPQEELRRFLEWPDDTESPILSLYLDINSLWDQLSQRKFEVTLRSMVHSLELKTEARFHEDLRRDAQCAWKFLANYEPAGRSLIIFADDSRNFLWVKELKVHIASQIHWLPKPYILPLLEIFDEYERYGVVLAGRGSARLFTFMLGQVEEERDALAWNDVQYMKSTGRDNLRSQIKLQRTTEMHAAWHLKHVARILKGIAGRHGFDRLILGGTQEAADELYLLLPPALREKVVGRLALPVHTDEKKLEEALVELEAQTERRKEEEMVRKLVDAEPPENHRALGLDAVLNFLDKGRVHQLIYSEHFQPQGGRCWGCGYLYAGERLMCGRCRSAIAAVPNLMEDIARSVIQKKGTLEEVRGSAALELDKAGGIGALLKGGRR